MYLTTMFTVMYRMYLYKNQMYLYATQNNRKWTNRKITNHIEIVIQIRRIAIVIVQTETASYCVGIPVPFQ